VIDRYDVQYGLAWGLLGTAFSLATDYGRGTTIAIVVCAALGFAVLTDWLAWRFRSGG
jgi:uncharacterized membrane protein YdcZ (DUF606 family)